MTKLRISDQLTLPLDWMSLATVVYGARGSGKTTFGSVVAEEVTKAKQRFCAIDLKGDWYGLKSTADGKGDGIPIVVFGGDHADVPLEENAGAFVGETVASMSQSCVLDFEHMSKGKQIRFLGPFFETLYHHNREPLLLLLDEAQRYATQKPMSPDEARCLGAVQDSVKLGRKHGLGLVIFTQRGAGLNKEVSELCDMLVAFRTPGPLDQDRIKDWLDANATEVQRKEVMSQLAGLNTGTAVFASGHPDLRIFGTYPVRRRETFDSSATPKIGQRRAEPKKLAQADLDDLRTKMSAAIERQKADDPKELRRRIAELERELKAKPAAAPPKVERVEVPVFDREAFATLERSLANDLSAALATVKSAFRASLHIYQTACLTKSPPARGSAAPNGAQVKPGNAPGLRDVRPAARPAPQAKRDSRRDGASIGAGERAVLTAVAQTPSGVTRELVTILTGYKRSTRDAYLQRLSAAGYVGQRGSLMVATESGLDALGPEYEPLPTGSALREHWLTRLPEGERKVFDVAIEAYPESVTRDAVSVFTGYKRSTRDAYIQRLGVRKLIEVARDGVRAAEDLFT